MLLLLRVQLLRPKVMGGFVVKLLEQSARLERASIQVWSLCRPVASIGNTLYSVVVVEGLFVETMHGQLVSQPFLQVQPIYFIQLRLTQYGIEPVRHARSLPDLSLGPSRCPLPGLVVVVVVVVVVVIPQPSHSMDLLPLSLITQTCRHSGSFQPPYAPPGHHTTDQHATQFFGSRTWPPDRDAPPWYKAPDAPAVCSLLIMSVTSMSSLFPPTCTARHCSAWPDATLPSHSSSRIPQQCPSSHLGWSSCPTQSWSLLSHSMSSYPRTVSYPTTTSRPTSLFHRFPFPTRTHRLPPSHHSCFEILFQHTNPGPCVATWPMCVTSSTAQQFHVFILNSLY